MADMRRAQLPENFSYYCSGLSGFTEGALERVCRAFEEEAISDFLHGAERFPELGRMQDLCRSASFTAPVDPLSPEMREYYRDLKAHPEEYVPIQLIIRDVFKRVAWKRERAVAGNPVSKAERDVVKQKQIDATQKEWREMLKEKNADDREAIIQRMSKFRLDMGKTRV